MPHSSRQSVRARNKNSKLLASVFQKIKKCGSHMPSPHIRLKVNRVMADVSRFPFSYDAESAIDINTGLLHNST